MPQFATTCHQAKLVALAVLKRIGYNPESKGQLLCYKCVASNRQQKVSDRMEDTSFDEHFREHIRQLYKRLHLKEEVSWNAYIKHLREQVGITEETPPDVQIKRLRQKLNLTQEEVAAILDVGLTAVSRWERSKRRKPGRLSRSKLYKFLRIPVEAWKGPNDESEEPQEHIPPRTLHEQELPYPHIWNVPFRLSLFVGRQEVLQKLHEALLAGKTPSLTQAISGLGGIGKTYTALQYAYQYRGEYHEAVWWVDASTRESLIAGLTQLAYKVSKVPISKLADSQHALRVVGQWMRDTAHWLLILDNVDDVALIYDNGILPTSRRGHVLLTTRTQATGTSVVNVELDDLTAEEGALQLLRKAELLDADAPLKDADDHDREHAIRLSYLMSGLPLALVYAGAYIKEVECNLAAYTQLYERRQMDVLKWRGSASANGEFSYPHSVATTWSLSFDKVAQSSQAAVDLLRIYAFLSPDTIPEEIVIDGSSRLGPNLQHVQDEFSFNQVIAELRRYSLIHRNTKTQTVNIHRLVQAVFRDKMDVKTQFEWVERTVGAIYLALIRTQAETLPDLERYVPQLQACTKLIEQWRLVSDEVAALLLAIGSYFSECAWYDLAEQCFKQAEKICEHVFGAESDAMVFCENRLAIIYLSQEKYDKAEARYKVALAISEKVWGEQHYNVASCLHELAHLARLQGNYERAEAYYQRALDMRRNALEADHPDIAVSLNGLANLYRDQGKYDQAEPLFSQALRIRQRRLDPKDPDLAVSYMNLAGNYIYQRRYDEAEPLCQQALELFERTMGKEHLTVAHALTALAEVYSCQRKYDQAEPLLWRSLQICEKLLGGAHTEVAESLTNLGALHEGREQYEEAESFYKQAQAIVENAVGEMHPRVMLVLRNYMSLLRKMGRENEAQELDIRIRRIQKISIQYPEDHHNLTK